MKKLSLNKPNDEVRKKKRRIEEDPPLKKKKKVVEEDPPLKKKKKRISEEPEVSPKKKKKDLAARKKLSSSLANLSKSISKLDEEGRDSIMGSKVDQIQEMLEVGHSDSAMALIQKQLLQTLVDLIPHAENNVRATKGQKGVYQINSLITSVREVLSDIQATKDRGAIGVALVEKVIRPAFLDIGMEVVQEEQRFVTAMRDLVSEDVFKKLRAEHKECVSRIGHTMKQKYEEMRTGSINFLQT